MGRLWWVPYQNYLCPYKNGKFEETEREREGKWCENTQRESHGETEAEVELVEWQAKEHQGFGTHPESRKRQGSRVPGRK